MRGEINHTFYSNKNNHHVYFTSLNYFMVVDKDGLGKKDRPERYQSF